MKTKTLPGPHSVENDSRLLFWFAIALMCIMLVISLFTKKALLQPALLLPYLLLFAVHIFLHFQVAWVGHHRRWLPGYILLQGLLAFGVTYLSGNIGMVFCLFMALIGEFLGAFRFNRMTVLACIYLLCLAFTNFLLLVGIRQAWWFALATIPTITFIGIYVILYSRMAEANGRAQRLLAELEGANRQLRDYSAQVEDLTLAAERQRMARELHDTLSQGLAGLILQLEAVDANLANGREGRAREIVQQSMVKARGTLAEARQAIDNLRRPAERNLADAVKREIEHFSGASGIECETQIDLPGQVPEPVAEAAVRAVSEGLTNIVRHAQAKCVSLRLSEENQVLAIRLVDDGIGFDPEAVQAGHYGLVGMRERVRLAGGSMEVESQAGKGTSLLIRFPLEEAGQ